MTTERKIANFFRLNDETWMRHANPWSVWTRYTVLPLFVLAVWSRIWLSWWCLIPIALSVIWTFVNPVLFPKPSSTRNWASKAVLGERVYLNRDNISIPNHHKKLPGILNGITAIGLMPLTWGILVMNVWLAMLGIVWIYIGKTLFLNRMVHLFDDMQHHPEYNGWLY